MQTQRTYKSNKQYKEMNTKVLNRIKELSELYPHRAITPKQVVETMRMVKNKEISYHAARIILKECAEENLKALRSVKKLMNKVLKK